VCGSAHLQQISSSTEFFFVYSCDTRNKKIGKQGITESVKFFMSMEIRDVNPVGLMVLEHLKNHIDGLYKYFMKGKTIEESVGASLTKDIDKYCRRGYNLIWSDLLNRCMVDYNIIHILKTYVGYTH
jgi:hypothetical protein